MIRVTSREALRSPPSYAAAKSWLHFHAHPALWGVVFWGRPDRDDAEALAPSLRTELDKGILPHAFLVDAERLESIDPDAFSVLSEFFQSVHSLAQDRYTAVGLIVPSGVPGAVVAGFYGALTIPCPFKAFTDRRDALLWLREPLTLGDTLTNAVTSIRSTPAIIDQLAAFLRDRLATADADEAARHVGLSPRTLQRRLSDVGTTFQKELLRLRIAAAQRRLLETDTPLTVIALDLGFATPQHFSRSFGEIVGQTPTEYRRRQR
jgi:AraC-like DNA-binding protein